MSLLRQLERADPPEARRIAHELRCVLGSYPGAVVDLPTYERIVSALRARGLDLGCPWRVAPPAPGVTWILLASAERGYVARVCYGSGDAPAGAIPLDGGNLRDARRGLAAWLRNRSCAPRIDSAPHLVVLTRSWASETVQAVGSSHGLAACIAALSAWTDGRLAPVEQIDAKLQSVAAAWPNVRRVAVAVGQDVTDPAGLEIVPCRDLGEAFDAFGFVLARERLPLPRLAQLRSRVEQFAADNDAARDGAGWRALASEALVIADALSVSDPPFDRSLSIRAAGWAGLFLLHAGENAAAGALMGEIFARPDEDLRALDPAPRAALRVQRAAIVIDSDPTQAVALAEEALRDSAALAGRAPTAFPQIRGRAIGTLGRALLHAGRAVEAVAPLREAVDFHAAHFPEQEARSRCYLATGLRLAGDVAEALAETGRALAVVDPGDHATRPYLELERARCLQALGRYADARVLFDEVARTGSADTDHPRISALRGLAAVNRALGENGAAREALDRCLRVAEQRPDIIGQVAAAAAGDLMVAGEPSSRRVLEAWQRHFGAAGEEVRRALARVVY